jgi:hypothetical protein
MLNLTRLHLGIAHESQFQGLGIIPKKSPKCGNGDCNDHDHWGRHRPSHVELIEKIGFCAYGLIDNATAARAIAALPIGLSEGCVLRRDISKDAVLSFNDVEAPLGREVEALWREQNARWPLPTRGSQPTLTQQVPAGVAL